MIVLRRPWAQQPQTFADSAPENRLANGLVLAWVATNLDDKSPYKRHAIVDGAGLFRPTRAGYLGYDNNGAGTISFANLPAPGSNALTALRVFTFTSSAAFTSTKLSYGVPYGANWAISAYISGSTLVSDSGAVSLGTNQIRNTLVCTYPGTGTVTRFSLNGGAEVNVTASGTFTGSLVCRIGANTNDPTAGRTINCFHELVMLWNRELSTSERHQIVANPYMLFAPRKIIIPKSTASIVTPTLTAASAINIGSTYATPRVTFTR